MNIPEVTTSTQPIPPQPEQIRLPMVCACGDDNPTVVELREWAEANIGSRAGTFSQAVLALNWNYNAEVTWIGSDQWFGLSVETYDHTLRVGVECDRLEDGIVAILRYFHERSGEGTGEVKP